MLTRCYRSYRVSGASFNFLPYMDSREGGGIVTLSTELTTHIFLQKIKSWAEDIFSKVLTFQQNLKTNMQFRNVNLLQV